LQGGQGIRFSRQAAGDERYLDIVWEGPNFRVTLWADWAFFETDSCRSPSPEPPLRSAARCVLIRPCAPSAA
jgi:hypothetical protein